MYYVEYDIIINDDHEKRFQFYVYKESIEDWLDAYSADDVDSGYEWAIEWIQKTIIISC